jgi:hypothetical protein
MAAERYLKAFNDLYSVCKEEGWGDPFSYARSREIHMAIKLCHRVATTYAGPDGIDENGDKVEYKSTIGKKIAGAYTGISVQDTWEKQLEYLQREKIGCYKWHYFARYEEDRIVEMWRLEGQKVLEILVPRIFKQFHTEKKRKDPRLCATLTHKDITTYGERIGTPSPEAHQSCTQTT